MAQRRKRTLSKLVTGRVWSQITAEARRKRAPALVAVAYFGKNASKLLDLPAGSRLVVNASENAVKTGQTHPADLLRLLKRGVRIFSSPLLHSKVYVFGKRAAIGSANTSNNSAQNLIEAMVFTTDSAIVKQASEFVRSLAKNQVGPEELKALQKLYKPPKLVFGARRRKSHRSQGHRDNALPSIRLVNLTEETWTDEDQAQHDTGEKAALERREHPRSWIVDSFRWVGSHSFQPGDKVMMVTKTDSGRRLADAPGTVLYIKTYRRKTRNASFIYVEFPDRRRRRLEVIAKRIGRGALNRLRRGGRLNADISAKMYDLWSE